MLQRRKCHTSYRREGPGRLILCTSQDFYYTPLLCVSILKHSNKMVEEKKKSISKIKSLLESLAHQWPDYLEKSICRKS